MMVSKQVCIVVVGSMMVCAGMFGASLSPVHAQAPAAEVYPALTLDPNIANAQGVLTEAGKKLQKDYIAVLKGQVTPPWDDNAKKILDDWYKGYWFRSMTHEINRGKLPDFRTQLIDRDIRTAKNRPAVQHLFGLTLQYMKGYAQSTQLKCHPAVRYNAMLILGDLNEVERGARNEATGGPAAQYPDPLPAALDIMVAEYNSPTQIDAVRVAAMVGILRHAKLDWARPAERRITTAKRREILDAMLALLNAAPPAGRTPEGHVWMQRRGIEIASALGAVGQPTGANQALESIVDNDKADFSLRLAAAEALSLCPADAKVPLDAPAFARKLGGLAAQACSAEVSRLATVEKRERERDSVRTLLAAVIANPFQVVTASTMGESQTEDSYNNNMMMDMSAMQESYTADNMSMMFGQGYSAGGGAAAIAIPTDPLVNLSRRRLKGQLVIVQNALARLSTSVKADAQKTQAIDKVAIAVKDALAATDPPTGEQDVKGMKKSLETGMKKLKPFAAVAAAAAAPDPLSISPASEAAPAATPPAATTPEAAATPLTTPATSPAPTAPDPAAAAPAPTNPAAPPPAAPAAAAPTPAAVHATP